MKKFFSFSKPEITNSDISYISKILKSGWIGTGPITNLFEKKFAEFKKVDPLVIALNSCTSALSLALNSLKIKKHSEIITTPMTFCSTINTIVNASLKPVFVDIKENTRNIDEDKIEKQITKRQKHY